jgi:hypothetical protein
MAKRIPPSPAPRYDDVFFEGTSQLTEGYMRTICAHCLREVEPQGDQKHCTYPDGRVRWCYVGGCVLVAGLEGEAGHAQLPRLNGVIVGSDADTY